MEIENLFIQASRTKLRIEIEGFGLLSVEDLWDLPLLSQRQLNLNTAAQSLYRKLQAAEEVSFVEVKAADKKVASEALALEIVKYVIKTKMEESVLRETEKLKAQQRAKLSALIESKKNEVLSAASLEELQAELAKLG